jgi:para-nitrobenzyl esterase
MNRRRFLVQSMMAAAVGTRLARAQSNAVSTVVQTGSGLLRGESAAGVNVFRGVPFAQPPVGDLRFRAPQAAQPWSGVRDATRFAAAAIQPDEKTIAQSEDCLYLNVWAPQHAGPHPVFVWIHGGGFTGGHSFDPLFDGTGFAQQGIVCVTIAYRLGVFGFLDVEPMLGPAYAGSANNAMLDIMQALAWLQQNVAAFGGDPHRVTVGGESAGAKLTDMLMGVPSAQGLFHQMVSESGGAERIWPEARARDITAGFAQVWSESSGQAAEQLKSAPAAQILTVQEQFTRSSTVHFPLRAEIDRTLVPQPPLDTIRKGSTRGKRLLLGTNHDESAMFIGPHPRKDPAQRDLGNLSLQQYEAIEERYRKIDPGMSEDLLRIRCLTAEEYWIPSLRVADAHLEGGGTAFVYRFDYAAPGGFYAGLAFHASELPYVWDHLGKEPATAAMATFADSIHAAWCTFIKGEAPQAPGLPEWPPYSTAQRPTMILNLSSHVEDAPQKAEFEAWSGLLMH